MTKSALILGGDLWHSAAVVRRGIKALGDCGFDFEWPKNSADWTALSLKKFSLIVLAKSNVVSATDKRHWLMKDSEQDFCQHIRCGGGLVVIHSGTAGYAELPAMHRMIGGKFLQHPPQCLVTIKPKRRHSLTKGVAPFTIQDEHYFVKLDDTRAKVFLHSHSEYGTQPAGWTRVKGKGRICVLTPGHTLEVWLHPEFQKLLLNAVRWAAKLN